jgi:hypothetical protein
VTMGATAGSAAMISAFHATFGFLKPPWPTS